MEYFEKNFSPEFCQINFRKSHKTSRGSDKKENIDRVKLSNAFVFPDHKSPIIDILYG